MWPRRLIEFLFPPSESSYSGVCALLKLFNIQSRVYDPSLQIVEFPTEQLFWTGIKDEDKSKVTKEGISQKEMGEFLHSFLSTELVLVLPENTLVVNDLPLLVNIMDEAGYEPSYLWYSKNGEWIAKRGRGIHWVLPGNWLREQVGNASLGRQINKVWQNTKVVLTDNRVDFYKAESSSYIGSLPRCLNLEEENSLCDSVQRALDIGIPWKTITKALSRIDREEYKNLSRWNINAFERVSGSGGDKLSTA